MDTAEDFVSAVGIIIILAIAALVFRTTVRMVFGKRRNQALLGLQFVILFGVAYAFHGGLSGLLGLGDYADDIGRVVAALLWFAIAFLVTGALNRYVWRGILSVDGQPTVPRLLTDFVQVFIYLAAIMVVMHFVYDQSITAIVATSGAFAFIIGYSAQSTLAELFAGVSLNLARSIKKGDIVSIDDTFGRVSDINWRCVSIMEPKLGSTVVIPNSQVAGAKFTNSSLPEPLYRRAVYFTVEFSAPPDLVIEATTEHLRRARWVLSDPAPLVHVRQYTELGIEYRALWYIRRDGDWWPAWNEAHEAIWSALRAHGLQPGLNHRFAGPGGRFDEDAWSARTRESAMDIRANLADTPLFEKLPAARLDELAAAVIRHDAGVTDVLCKAGEEGGALYVIARGRVVMLLTDEAGQAYSGAELAAGDVFGLAGAVDGTAHRASAQASRISVVYEIPAEAVGAAVKKSKRFAGALKKAAEDRARAYEMGHGAYLRELARENNKAEKQRMIRELAGRIRGIFSGGVTDNLRALFTGAEESREGRELLEAIMAGSALVAAADDEIEAEERGHVVRTLQSLDLLEQLDMEADEALGRFDAYCEDIVAEPEDGVGRALDVVAKVATNRDGAELVIGICVAVSAADGEVEPAEEARIAEIRRLLNVGAGDDAEG